MNYNLLVDCYVAGLIENHFIVTLVDTATTNY